MVAFDIPGTGESEIAMVPQSRQVIDGLVDFCRALGNGQTSTVTSNTATTLTIAAVGTGLDNTSKFKLYRQTSETTPNKTVGALARHDNAEQETGTTDAGSVGLPDRLVPPGRH